MSLQLNDNGIYYKITTTTADSITFFKCDADGNEITNLSTRNRLDFSNTATTVFSGYDSVRGLTISGKLTPASTDGTGIILRNQTGSTTTISATITAGQAGLGFASDAFVFSCPTDASDRSSYPNVFQVETYQSGTSSQNLGTVNLITGNFVLSATTARWSDRTLVKSYNTMDNTFPDLGSGYHTADVNYRSLYFEHNGRLGIFFNNTSTSNVGFLGVAGGATIVAGSNVSLQTGGLAYIQNGNERYNILTAQGEKSDISKKTNIVDYTNCLNKIINLRPVSFDWIDKNDQVPNKGGEIGFIAQEVQPIIPEVIVKGRNDLLHIRYEQLTAVLAGAIKELKQQVDEQQKLIDKLSAQINVKNV